MSLARLLLPLTHATSQTGELLGRVHSRLMELPVET
jgi:hypothetical protein